MSSRISLKERNQAICVVIRASNGCVESDLERALALADSEGARVERVLVRLGFVEEAVAVSAACDAEGVRFLTDLSELELDISLLTSLSPAYLNAKMMAPIETETGTPTFLMADPGDTALVEEVEFHLSRSIDRIGVTTALIRQFLTQSQSEDTTADENLRSRDQSVLRATEADGPVIRYVNEKLTDAVLAGASDVHFESTSDSISIRYRINGSLVVQPVDTRIPVASVFARLKVMADANVVEKRMPQDGRFTVMMAGRSVDFRFSSLPTHWGESVVCRVLDPRALKLGWSQLGFPTGIAEQIQSIIEQPSGLFLVTGPTGSGKTTTLYTALTHLNTQERKIVTVEDPVEYNIPGIQQVQVHDSIGLTFGRILRGVLRHDPNVILVGEIRDEETAEIACRAAQVGRIVLSTLHTNSANGAVSRLIDLGVPEFIVKDVLRGVLAQTLVAVRCSACGGGGCRICGRSGVSGRKPEVELVVH